MPTTRSKGVVDTGVELAEVKVNVNGLVVGMFVCRLDRPWLETPLPFQGFRIKSPKDIAQPYHYPEGHLGPYANGCQRGARGPDRVYGI